MRPLPGGDRSTSTPPPTVARVYEMFDEDAQTAADELDLMLTTRDRNKPPEEQTPMCGVPYHAADSYIKKLIDHGHKVAVCDQLEDPALTKGLVKRDVIRVITPGTVTDEGMLDYERPNYLCALWLDGRRGGAAFCDVSTGEFCAADFPDFAEDHTLNELTRFSPNEAVLSAGAAASRRVTDFITTRVECMYQVEDAGFEYAAAERQLLHHFGVSSLEELGLAGCEGAVRASGALLGYIGETQKCDMKHIAASTSSRAAGTWSSTTPRAAAWSSPRLCAAAKSPAACWAYWTSPRRPWAGGCSAPGWSARCSPRRR